MKYILILPLINLISLIYLYPSLLWYVFLLIIYFTSEIVSIIATKTLVTHKIFIYFRLRKQLKKIIPSWWRIKEINLVTIEKASEIKGYQIKGYKVYVEVSSKIEKGKWTNDFVIVDYLGRIKKHGLSRSIKILDKGHEMEIKEWNRDKVLNELGI